MNQLMLHGTSLVMALTATLGTGGLIGAWLRHKREAPKVQAEATQMDWHRFQEEIKRLDARLAAADAKAVAQDIRIDELEGELRKCHHEHDSTKAELIRLKAIIDGRGEVRQMAAGVVAMDRLLGDKG